jgi:hypothetical protein
MSKEIVKPTPDKSIKRPKKKTKHDADVLDPKKVKEDDKSIHPPTKK